MGNLPISPTHAVDVVRREQIDTDDETGAPIWDEEVVDEDVPFQFAPDGSEYTVAETGEFVREQAHGFFPATIDVRETDYVDLEDPYLGDLRFRVETVEPQMDQLRGGKLHAYRVTLEEVEEY